MSAEVVSILVLAAIFAIAIGLSVNMGLLAFAAAFLVGTLVADLNADEIFAVFPGDIFVVLVGITYLFGIAQLNGTVDWLVNLAMRGVGGRVGAIPWVMFGVAAVLTAIGAVSPAAVAIVAPIALGFAVQFKINPLLMGVLVVHGAQAGGFSPISVYGTIVNDALADTELAQTPPCFASFASHLRGRRVFVLFRRAGFCAAAARACQPGPPRRRQSPRTFRRRHGLAGGTRRGSAPIPIRVKPPLEKLTAHQIMTLIGLVALVAITLIFEVDVGLVAISVAVVLTLAAPGLQKRAIDEIKWPVVLLITGVLTYVGVLEEMGTIDWVGEEVADVGAPLSPQSCSARRCDRVAFASSVGVWGVIPLAVRSC